MPKYYLFLLVILFPFFSNAQTLWGTSGAIRTPDAFIFEDGSIMAGFSFYPKQEFQYSDYKRNGFGAYTTCTFLPFMEVSLRITRMQGNPDNHNFDRTPSIRLQLLKEKKFLPAIVFGAHDFLTTLESGDARHFSSTYLVTGKTFEIEKIKTGIQVNAGYAYPFQKADDIDMDGFFTSASFFLLNHPYNKLMIDYDTKIVSYGLSIRILKYIHIQNSLLNGKHWSGTIALRKVL